ncbi:endonuclease/exonuclease/phosphatase family protein [Rhodopirellula maiorica SM1]|uniref:Endonuclease/exonuclease/phosphatase family protein n=1 Tax=Rhodopirellula maiorica SM1 TaxID=1265738 RepID=M5R8P9_9BACT|nr:endonuclease/exonuclease/phosphatase family protein [Rhodopirellula maiorica SM1]
MGDEPVKLRILSYNIHHAEGIDGRLDLQRIANVIREVKPDLVALQEVDQNVRRSQSVDQPAELARLTDMNVVFGANIPLQGGHYGNAVLSRFPIVKQTNHLLPNLADGEQRGYIEVTIEIPGVAEPLRLMATHFDHRPDERERLESADAINARAKDQPQQIVLLAGDMNAVPDSETMKRLGSTWTSASAVAMSTIPVTKPTRQIDFILYRPQDRWRVVDVKVLDESVASDHRPIFAVIELQPAE